MSRRNSASFNDANYIMSYGECPTLKLSDMTLDWANIQVASFPHALILKPSLVTHENKQVAKCYLKVTHLDTVY